MTSSHNYSSDNKAGMSCLDLRDRYISIQIESPKISLLVPN